MDILTYTDAERYLANKQVYFRKEIANMDFKTIAEANKVHNIKNVDITRLSDEVIAFKIVINDVETTIYEYKTDLELFAWIKNSFIPVSELINSYERNEKYNTK